MAKTNGKHLVIVESPAKAKTINKYLGDDYVVKASMGHVRDLPEKAQGKGDVGVDLKTFVPRYEIITRNKKDKLVTELKKLAKQSDQVYLATDLDREGEAIAWHLKEALGIPDERAHRVIFNAITKAEIQKAFRNPTHIDMDRVNAQQARRILDRIVGWEISPILWRKVPGAKSAGRVQSVAVRLVVDREREIEAFVPAGVLEDRRRSSPPRSTPTTARSWPPTWVDFLTNTGNGERTKVEREKWLAEHDAFVAELVEFAGKKFEASDKDQARRAAEALGFVVDKAETTEDAEAKGPATPPDDVPRPPGRSARRSRSARSRRSGPPAGRPPRSSPARSSSRPRSRLGFGASGHEDRPDAVRGRPHHLHAYRLDEPLRRGAEHGPHVHRRRVRPRSTCRRSPTSTARPTRAPGGPRGDPPDRRQPDARRGPRQAGLATRPGCTT